MRLHIIPLRIRYKLMIGNSAVIPVTDHEPD